MKGERKEKKKGIKNNKWGVSTQNPEKLSDKTAAQRGERGAKKGTAGLNLQTGVRREKKKKEKKNRQKVWDRKKKPTMKESPN